MPQDNVYFKHTLILPDPKGPLSKKYQPFLYIIDTIVIKVT